jgi:phosphomannomutase/phosphoglucomutase
MIDMDAGLSTAQFRKSAPLLAVLLALFAAWFAWSGVAQWRADARGEQLAVARDQLVADVTAVVAAQTRTLDAQLAREDVQAALAAGDAAAAAAALSAGWKGAEQAQFLRADLIAPYSQAASFGYARLGLLESALDQEAAVAAVVRDDGGARLGVAAPVTLAGVSSVAYVRLPLAVLTASLDRAAVPGATYLALRQGGYNVAQRGEAGLAGSADVLSREVGTTGLRAVAAVPDVARGPFGFGALACVVAAGLLAVLAVLVMLLAWGKLPQLRRKAAEATVEELPTLGQTIQRDLETLPAAPARAAPVVVDVQLEPGIFRAYDIRGVVGRELTPQVAAWIGQAVGSVMAEQGLTDIVVGRDGRLSGPELAGGLIEGLRRAGRNVIDVGMVPTPVVYFAAYHLRAGSGVAVTGSHNPPDYNGFKIVVGGETLSGDAILDLYARIRDGRLHQADTGSLQQQAVDEDYIRRIADDVQLERPLKVVVDAGNGVAGEIGPRLLEAIGAEVIPLYCEVDGSFPNHHPDPSDPHNLEDLVQMVKRFDADLGLAFDGDGDRLGVVTREGRIIYPDRLLMLYAADVLQRNPGALVIYDVKCTGKLSDYVLRHGGSPLMWKTGHSLIKSKMRETEAELAGEMSGHFFFKERWYGFDDGLYSAARLLEILAGRVETPSEVLDELPDSISTPEIKVPVDGADAHALVASFAQAAQAEDSPFSGARLTTIDGLRADWNDGWGLVRASNTTPVLVLRFEADDQAALVRIKELYREQLRTLLPGAALDF